MTTLTKVTMNLTERDVKNTEKLFNKLHSRSKADAVSAALSIASALSDHLDEGEELYVLTKNGETKRLIITGLE